ncbi:exopolysaccharide biosynthesis polyprenyl glycosylphosphotransferase [Flavobacterium psychrophilum]|uniref:exopolysaccharide biosynthesis polyprenyl glycosylphosphotransferase n=1 Tax=Flavobacterium psychrophilum TaxID=96345 RepID=UPI000B8E9A32|nr:exopolysaccharide biosynthesis polyprenyl glycosylphosphotransferase [Flavobacterium psychrophilum]EKT3965407.1 exopolysaccharide biosynthesis polyprenyl glycosylphosphotransferase [Flavobacterium psychrophilum]ELY2009348.1 exopolysaccharide biosynthesis polyprenyl glycosylphosphotransferase [Flavobacterium psychrophilum]MCB6087601.1 exopolysaccharide biosynthesis polyprenyl glycosylphosphotransferase [Flavobacterium psychrophilum]
MNAKTKIHFEMSERKILLRFFDVVSVLGLLDLLGIVFDFYYFKISETNFYWTIILSVYLLFFGSVFEMYNLQVASNQFQITKSILLVTFSTVLLYLLTPIITPALPENRFQILLFFSSILVSLFLWRIIYVRFFASTRFGKKAILICNKSELEELVKGLQSVDPHYKIEGYINSDTKDLKEFDSNYLTLINLDTIEDFIIKKGISEIVIASQKTEGITVELYSKLMKLLENGFVIREYTQVYESITQRIPVQYLARDFYKYFPFSRSNHNKLYLIIVRVLSVLTSVFGLLIGLSMLPFVLLGNLLGNRGPLFYTQDRVGKNGKIFKIYKFRSMIINAESSGAVFATANDSRITPFGKFLRKTRIDEVPQFINVIKGDMSVIGPRPERPFFVKEIAQIMPFYETRHVLKPGVTGWAQVNYSYGETIADSLIKLQYDLYYIKHRSIYLDLNIMVKTISTVLFYKGQ